MNEPTVYTVKELNCVARNEAKQAARANGFNSASSVQWRLRISDICTSLLIQYRCSQDPTSLFETDIVI